MQWPTIGMERREQLNKVIDVVILVLAICGWVLFVLCDFSTQPENPEITKIQEQVKDLQQKTEE